jgi:hypothetical protein
VIGDWSFPVVAAMPAFSGRFCPRSNPTATEKKGIAAKDRKEKERKFNQSAATAKIWGATKIICNCFAFLVSFFCVLCALLRLLPSSAIGAYRYSATDLS